MPPDSLLRRVRWGNLARVCALPAVVLLVVLWPRLSPPPPSVPGAAPSPVAAPAAAPAPAPAQAPAPARPREKPTPKPKRARRAKPRRRPRRAKTPRRASKKHPRAALRRPRPSKPPRRPSPPPRRAVPPPPPPAKAAAPPVPPPARRGAPAATAGTRANAPGAATASSAPPGGATATTESPRHRVRHAMTGAPLRLLRRPGLRADVRELVVDPVAGVAGVHDLLEPREPLGPLVGAHRQRGVDRVGELLDVERVHRQGVLAELLVRAGVLGEDRDAVTLVDHRPLLRDEVHAVEHRVDEEHVVVLVRRDRLLEVVAELQVDRHPVRRAVAMVDDRDERLDALEVLGVLRHVGPRRHELGDERHALAELRVLLEEQVEGAEAAQDVLRQVGP